MEPQKLPLNPITLDESPYETPQAVVQQVAPVKRSWNPFGLKQAPNPWTTPPSMSRLKGKAFIAAVIITFLVLAGGVGYLLFKTHSKQSGQTQQAPLVQDNGTTVLTTQHLQINVPLKVIKQTTLSGLTVGDNADFQSTVNFLQGIKVTGDSTFNGNVTVTGTINGSKYPATGPGTTSASGSTGPKGDQGPAGLNGANGPSGTNGATGPQGPSGTASCPNGPCLSLQSTSPGVQETGNVNISGNVTSGGLLAGAAGSVTPGFTQQIVQPGVGWVYGLGHAIASDGFSRIAYFASGDYALYYARCTDADCLSTVITQVLPPGLATSNYMGSHILTLGSDGFARILYVDSSDYSLKMVRCLDTDCTTHNVSTIDDNSSSNYPGYQGAEVVMGSDGFPRIAYADDGNAYEDHFVRCNNADCTSLVNTPLGNNDYNGYQAISLALGSDGFGRVVFEDGSDYQLKMIRCLDADCSSHNTDVVDSNAGNYPGYYGKVIRIGSDGFVRIAYVDSNNYTLWYAICNDVDCTSPTISQLPDTYGGTYNGFGMDLTNANLAYIAYEDNNNASAHILSCSNANCTSFSDAVVEDNGTSYSGGLIDQGASLVVDAQNLPRLAYADEANEYAIHYARFLTPNAVTQLNAGTDIGTNSATFGQAYLQGLTIFSDGSSSTKVLSVMDANGQPVAQLSAAGDLDLNGSLKVGGASGSTATLIVKNASGSNRVLELQDSLSNTVLFVDTANSNFSWGQAALGTLTTGTNNVALGANALFSTTDGYSNFAAGSGSLYSNTSGYQNIAIGDNSLTSNTTGKNNIALGINSLASNDAAQDNIAIGNNSLYHNTVGSDNIAIGPSTLYQNTSGGANIAIGAIALANNHSGVLNIALGQSTLSSSNGNQNVAIGSGALSNNTSGNKNTALGDSADVTSGSLTNATALGYNAKVDCSSCLVLGGTGADSVSVGIGTSNPATSNSTLSVARDYTNVGSGTNAISGTFNFQGNDTATGQQLAMNLNGASNVSNFTGTDTQVHNNGTGTVNSLLGSSTYVTQESSGNSTNIQGAIVSVVNRGTGGNSESDAIVAGLENDAGSTAYASGVNSIIVNSNSGQILYAYGLQSRVLNFSAGQITNAYGVNISVANAAGGTITNGYGLYIDTIKGSTNYGLYQADATNQNYFAGKVGVGATIPLGDLDVRQQSNGDDTIYAKRKTDSSPTGNFLRLQDATNVDLASIDISGNLTVKNATINGTLTVNGHIITGNGSGPGTSAAPGAAANCSGGSPSAVLAGNDVAGTVTISTGTGACSAGVLATITFNANYGPNPRIVLTPQGNNGATIQYNVGSKSGTNFTISTANAPTASTTYIYDYHIEQ